MGAVAELDPREVVRGMYAAVAEGDMDGFASRLADDVVLVEADGHPCPGTSAGRDEVLAALGRIVEAIGVTDIRVNGVIGEGETVCGLIEITCTNRAGETLDMPMIEKSTVRGGKVVRIEPYYFDTRTLAAHFSATAV